MFLMTSLMNNRVMLDLVGPSAWRCLQMMMMVCLLGEISHRVQDDDLAQGWLVMSHGYPHLMQEGQGERECLQGQEVLLCNGLDFRDLNIRLLQVFNSSLSTD